MITRDNATTSLLKFRSDHKLTQEKLSEKTGVSVQTISEIESGKVKPQSMTVFKLNSFMEKFNK